MGVVAESLEQGQAYYRLTFADSAHTVPAVEPMIYVGMNVFPDEDAQSRATHYFQDAISFRICGSAADVHFQPHPEVEPVIYRVEAGEVSDSLLDLDGLIEALVEARRRAGT